MSVSIAARRRRTGGGRTAWLFLLPWTAGLVLFIGIPAGLSLYFSFTKWNLLSSPEWIGFQNYVDLVGDASFWKSLSVTAEYIVLSVPVVMVFGLAVAMALNLKLPGIALFRTLLYLPSVLAGVAIAVLWLALLNADYGVVNTLLKAIGIDSPPRWLEDPSWAVPSTVLVAAWGVGGNAIIYLAGLQNIPPDLYEAASLDGAGPVRKFASITLPLLTPTLFFTLITSLIAAFQVFDVAYILGGSQGGREKSLLFYLLNLWNEAFRRERFGYASALSWVLILISIVVIVALMRTSRLWVYDELAEPEAEKSS